MGADYKKANQAPIMGASRDNHAANLTEYYAASGRGTFGGLAVVRIPCPVSGILEHLWYSSQVAPGAGETFDCTVYIDANPSVLTAQIAGAVLVAAQNLVDQEAVVEGQDLAIEIATSLNAAVTRHRWGFRIRC